MATRNPAATEKMECFEAIRGVASLGVLLGHLIIAFWPHLYIGAREIPPTFPRFVRWFALSPFKILYDSQFAVTIFFLLSGFVLSLSFFKSRSTEALTSAAVRRYFRLMLPAAASILLAYLLLKLGWMFNRRACEYMTQSLGVPHTWLGLFYNFRPHFTSALKECVWDTFFAGSTYNANLWTMSIELAGSFVVYHFLALFGTARNRYLLYAVLAGVFIYSNRLFLLDFLLGMVLCDAYVATQSWRFRLPVLLAVPVALAGLYVVTLKPFGQFDWGWLKLEKNVCYETFGGVLLLGAVAFSPRFQRLFDNRVLTFLGKISFGLYLIHLCLICSLASGLYVLLCRKLGFAHHPAALVAAGSCIVASLTGAWLMYLTVDRPAIALGKLIYRGLFQKKARPEGDAEGPAVTKLPAAEERGPTVLRKSA
jgi:peptidoglycan/LPS O-acetylase OafA/YrhL